ncbi:hypothetical protein [Halalkalicoccus salilacus]|uniref:hypothetical protein n=1 Tax=Halalkalicoccus salilacus TaxID=3117459 RepID=UPI00300F0060
MSDDVEQLVELQLPYQELWYIKLSGPDNKIPLETWGGYSQDFEDVDTVYSHEDVLADSWEWWGIVGIRGEDRSLLIFDFDVYKAPDEFDPDTVEVPSEATSVRSQSGGNHVYAVVAAPRGEGTVGEFRMEYDLGFDVDIRGSYVKHHVVAPSAIPGVGGSYELVNDEPPLSVQSPTDAADRIRYHDPESGRDYGEPLITYSPSGGYGDGIAIDRDVEPPDDMPTCYHRGLQARDACRDDPSANAHQIDLHAGLCGLAAGYDVETMVEHFVEDYPGKSPDEGKTRYYLNHLAGKLDKGDYSPSSLSSLREYGILDVGESCDCSIPYHGEEPVDTDDEDVDPSPVAAVPFERIARMNDADARELLEQRDVKWPDTIEARERLRDRVLQAFRAGESVVLDAPTALGKSHTVATEPWLYRTDATGDAPVIHLAPTRDARDENAEKSRKAGVNAATLKGRKDLCPVARGDHDPEPDPDREGPAVVLTVDGEPASEWMDRQCDAKANPFQLAHSYAAESNDQGRALPCCEGESECPAMTQWDGTPRDEDGNPAVDVVHATHAFAYVPGLRLHTNVVIDEAPTAFDVELTQDRIRRAVNAYLDAVNAPAKTYEALVTLATTDGYAGDIGAERDALEDVLGTTPGREWYVTHPDAHALAPDLARAIYRAIRWEDPDANGRVSAGVIHEPPRFDNDGGDGFGGNFLTVVLDDEHTIRSVRHAPDFSIARSVVGLDAYPTEPIWKRNVGPNVSVEPVLDDVERRLWRRFERGLTAVQVGGATRPLSGKNAREWFESDSKLDVLLRALRDCHGDAFATGITGGRVESGLRDRMESEGIDVRGTMHFGEEMSRGDFAGESVGLVNGCIDPGDDYVIDLLAELGLDATPERVDLADFDDPMNGLCGSCGGRRCSECGRTGLRRTKKRSFVGPDADTAMALLASVREYHVAQALGRYARDADDRDDSAIVYVRTDAIPDGLADARVNGVEWGATDLQRSIIHELAERGDGATVKGLMEDVGCEKTHTFETLTRLEERELVERDEGRGPNPDRWYAAMDSLADIDAVELVDVDEPPAREGENVSDQNDRRRAVSDGGNDGKAFAPTYRNSIGDSERFSAENERLSEYDENGGNTPDQRAVSLDRDGRPRK